MSRSRLALAAVLAVLGVAPAALTVWPNPAPAAPVPAHLFPKSEPEPNYFPDRVGTTRVYEVETLYANLERTEVVTGVENKNGMKVIRLTDSSTGNPATVWEWSITLSEAGVFQSNFPLPYTPAVCTFKQKCRPGETWESHTLFDTSCLPECLQIQWRDRFTTWKATAGEFEVVEVPAGTFRALRVDLETEPKYGMSCGYTSWYADGIGLVKQRYFTVGIATEPRWAMHTEVLKSFTPGKE